jgi:hypothetical protein
VIIQDFKKPKVIHIQKMPNGFIQSDVISSVRVNIPSQLLGILLQTPENHACELL